MRLKFRELTDFAYLGRDHYAESHDRHRMLNSREMQDLCGLRETFVWEFTFFHYEK